MPAIPPPADDVRAQLARILGSERFARAERLRGFLTYVVEETLAGRQDALKGFTIGVEALGRPDDFDPIVDPVVRVNAQRLRQALDLYYREEGGGDPVMITLARGSYVPRFALRRAEEAPAAAPPPLPRKAPRDAEVLVTPTAVSGDDPISRYIGQGLAGRVATEITAHDRVTAVVGAALGEDPLAAARARHLPFVLTSRVECAGEVGRLALQLHDAVTGGTLWGAHFDLALGDCKDFARRDAIALDVATQLADVYGVMKTRLFERALEKDGKTLSVLELSILFTEYKYRQPGRVSPISHERLTLEVERALREHPDDALLTAILAGLYVDAHVLAFDQTTDSLREATVLARRAMQLSPDAIQSNLAMAYCHIARHETQLAIARARRVAAIAYGSGYFLANAGWFIALAGAWDDGLALLRRGMQLSPRFPAWFHAVPCLAAYREGDYPAALAASLQFEEPELPWSPLLRAATLGRLGHPGAAEALAQLERALPSFIEQPWEYISRFIPDAVLVEALVEGLVAAGFDPARI